MTAGSFTLRGYTLQRRLEISEMLISFLMGHSLQGVSARYTNELMIANSQALREAQEKITPKNEIGKTLSLSFVNLWVQQNEDHKVRKPSALAQRPPIHRD